MNSLFEGNRGSGFTCIEDTNGEEYVPGVPQGSVLPVSNLWCRASTHQVYYPRLMRVEETLAFDTLRGKISNRSSGCEARARTCRIINRFETCSSANDGPCSPTSPTNVQPSTTLHLFHEVTLAVPRDENILLKGTGWHSGLYRCCCAMDIRRQ